MFPLLVDLSGGGGDGWRWWWSMGGGDVQMWFSRVLGFHSGLGYKEEDRQIRRKGIFDLLSVNSVFFFQFGPKIWTDDQRMDKTQGGKTSEKIAHGTRA